MNFLNAIKKHWKIASGVTAIFIATVVGVVLVKASTVTISLSLATINFAEGQTSQEIRATVDLSLENDAGVVGWNWTMVDTEVASQHRYY